ncbi:MAG: hypothetical protein C0475_06135 [Planctomyces sp.]|nr:hypothetical protein [Planctomyces sp.]MBA4120065.1 hypothetical protein [Isosphaera sp.]
MKNVFASLATLSLSAAALATPVQFVESLNGLDLSGNINAPTNLGVFSAGNNIVGGSVINALAVSTLPAADVDIFTFTIQAGFQLSGLIQLSFDGGTDPAPQQNFIALVAGSTFPFTPQQLSGTAPGLDTSVFLGALLGGDVDGGGNSNNFNQDLLPLFQTGANLGGVPIGGFSGPLQAGTYTFYNQQLGGGLFNYRYAFVVTEVPTPAAAGVLALGGLVAGRRRRTA